MSITVRENYLRAVRRQDPLWIPWYAWFTPLWEKLLEQKTGRSDYASFFQYPLKGVSRPKRPAPPSDNSRFFPYYPGIEIPTGSRFDRFGVLHVRGSTHHFTHMVHPMCNFTSAQEVLDYPWPEEPSYTDAEIADMRAQARRFHNEGWPIGGSGGGCFEAGWAMRGMDNMLADLLTGDEVSAAILDWFTEHSVRAARLSALFDADVIDTGDDVGMQDRMLMDPELWRRVIKPRHARIFAAARAVKPDIHITYHSDGYIEPIIPDLIEIGVDILNPVQPECMDQLKIKRTYGDRLALERCIGTQTVLPFGTPQSIEANVKWTIDNLGRHGGLILGPTHTIEPDVTWENFVAFYNAVLKHGGYQHYPFPLPKL